jgi:hypothetical protein
MLLKRYGKVGKTHASRSAQWTALPHYYGPQHEDLRQQSLAEFITNHPEQCEQLVDADVEAIRRGCILLHDALEGRASHGLHSLLDEPSWKAVLFQIQTSEAWQHVVLGGSFLHALLIAFEAPNWRAAHLDAAFDAQSLLLAEILIICVYVADAVMKMLYFGGKCAFPTIRSTLLWSWVVNQSGMKQVGATSCRSNGSAVTSALFSCSRSTWCFSRAV